MLPGLPPETAKVEFIWIPNDIQTRLEHVLVVARDGDRLLWDYEISLGAERTDAVVPLPFAPNDPDLSDNESLVKPKTQTNKKTEKE
jgi:hypothetical protein